MSPRRRRGRAPRPAPLPTLREMIEEIAASQGVPVAEVLEQFGVPDGADLDEDWDEDWDEDEDDFDEDWDDGAIEVSADYGAGRPNRAELRGSADAYRSLANPAVLDPRQVRQSIRRRLDDMRATDLRNLATEMGWLVRGQRRDDLLAQITAHYGDTAAWARALGQLGAADRRLLATAAWVGPVLRADSLAAIAGLVTGGPAGTGDPKAVGAQLEALYSRGWLVDGPRGQAERLAVAPALARALLPVPDLAPSAPTPPPAAVHVHSDPLGFHHGLMFALWACGEQPLSVQVKEELAPDGPSGGWLLRAVDAGRHDHGAWLQVPLGALSLPKSLQRYLPQEMAPGAGALLLSAVLGTDLLTVRSSAPSVTVALRTENLADWLALPHAQQLYYLVHAWLNLPYHVWSELFLAQNAGARFKVVRRHGAWNFAPTHFNQALFQLRWSVLHWLRGLPRPGPGGAPAWVAGEATLQHLATALGGLLVPAATAPWGYEGRNGQRIAPDSPAAWSELARPVLEAMFEGPLTWLGLVATARGRHGALALRLTPLGAALVDGTDLPMGGPIEALWQADGQLAVPPTGAATTVLALAMRYGTPVSFSHGRVRFTWSTEHVAAGFARGETPAYIAAAFEQAGIAPNTTAREHLAALAEHWGNVNLYEDLAVMTFADAVTAREVAHRADLGRVGVCQVDDTRWLVRAADVPQLVDRLRAAGHTPRVVDLAAASARKKAASDH